MKRKQLVLAVTAAVAVTAVLAGFVIKYKKASDYYAGQLGMVYARSLSDLNDTVDNIETVLRKSLYASTPAQLSSIAAELLSSAEAAKVALASLPSDGTELSVINRFLSQVGNYSQYLSEKVIKGGTVAEEETENLKALITAAGTIKNGVNEIQSAYSQAGSFSDELQAALDGKLPENGFASSLSSAEELIDNYPTLIYDGPFSDALLEGNSYLLDNSETIDREAARQKAAEALDLPVQAVTYSDFEDGRIQAYCFTAGNDYIAVSVQGGYIVYFRDSTPIEESKLTCEQAVEKARQYLNGKSGTVFTDTYYYTDAGVCVVNFAAKNGATVCYTDLVKVGVSMDTGKIVMVEARGFLMHNKPRTVSTPKYTSEEAQAILSDALEVKAVTLAQIPSGTGEEKHCYEFYCTGLEGEEILVYINTADLTEEDIFFLLKTDGGTLVK